MNIRSPYQVGKYGVNIENLEKIAVPSIISVQTDELIVIDEIGKMECFSNHFRSAVFAAFENP